MQDEEIVDGLIKNFKKYSQDPLPEITYNFSGQTAQETTGNWSPKAGTEMEDWVNGTSVVNGTYWTGTKTVKGWNLSNQSDGNATISS